MMTHTYIQRAALLLLCLAVAPAVASNERPTWTALFGMRAPEAHHESGIRVGTIGLLPKFTVRPDAPGRYMVRVSLPFAPGALPEGLGVLARQDDTEIRPDLRVLTRHPGRPISVRRALITFPFDFAAAEDHVFSLTLTEALPVDAAAAEINARGIMEIPFSDMVLRIAPDGVQAILDGERAWQARLIAPEQRGDAPSAAEIVEQGAHYLWARLLTPDPEWPRIIEVRADSLGAVVVRAHVQRMLPGDDVAPELGWRITGLPMTPITEHVFAEDGPLILRAADQQATLAFPLAHYNERGSVLAAEDGTVAYIRCRAEDGVPFQAAAWRSAAFTIMPPTAPPLTGLLESSLPIDVAAEYYQAAYGIEAAPCLSHWPDIEDAARFAHACVTGSIVRGDDFGNLTNYHSRAGVAGDSGMLQLENAPAIFESFFRYSDPALREAALLWCSNFFDQSIWWGGEELLDGWRQRPLHSRAGGTKHPHGREGDDRSRFQWRDNISCDFCTKGFSSFLYAYEETGDPRMSAALYWQSDYADSQIRVSEQTRNVGVVNDFLRLHRLTGAPRHRDAALRLFRELREVLSDGDLFSQSGEALHPNPPFINDDQVGLRYPHIKPFILDYALMGLPELLALFPDEPKLRDVVRATADYLAASQDPLGGWRYPHPKSSHVSLTSAAKSAVGLARAAQALEARGETVSNLVDAVERVLQCHVMSYTRTGAFLSGLQGWEWGVGLIDEADDIYKLYDKPEDRDPSRDYAEGVLSKGYVTPDGATNLDEALAFYVRRRPAERLLWARPALEQVLDRLPDQRGDVDADTRQTEYDRYGVRDRMPHFVDARVAAMDFPMSWRASGLPFAQWREKARRIQHDHFLAPPERAPFNPVVLDVEDRGAYEARKVAFNINADCRVLGYLLTPKGEGPFPAVLALHDHGAHFSIGKEKVVRPFNVPEEVVEDAAQWVDTYYGGRFIGDALAERGYVVFATDVTFWGDRGRAEGVAFAEQQSLAANMIQLGYSWSGYNAWDDIRSAEFLAGLPEVDPERVGAMGLSMGAYRSWQLSAATDLIKASAAICWMGDLESFMVPNQNQTVGQSAFSMIHPGLSRYLDYPDVASIACPKPMLIFAGTEDTLFPVDGVERCFDILRDLWRAQDAEDRLLCKFYEVPHLFNIEMQEEAFGWLDRFLKGED